MNEIIEEKLSLLAHVPGVYIMKDKDGTIIYVGKAISLKNRVTQYFRSHKNHSVKVKAMVARIVDFDVIIVGSEIEALILECNLIKKYRPKYNISLKDDKTYPYLKVSLNEDFPRLMITRKKLPDGGKYYGPFTDVEALHSSLDFLRKLFPLRTCRNLPDRPCLEYHIKRCLAPCAEKVSKEEYRSLIKDVCMFLDGKSKELDKDLEKRMLKAAEVLDATIGQKPKATDTVRVHYEGTLPDGTVFDSSYKRGEPISFPLNGVIAGWTEGLQLMSVGSKYKLFIPYHLGYGERGAGASIPPYSALIFTVELLGIE